MTDFETKYDHYYHEALELLSRSGSLADVYKLIDSLKEHDYRDVTLGKVARALAAQGRVDGAQQFCSLIFDSVERADSFLGTALELKKQALMESVRNFLEQSIQSSEEVESPSDRSGILLQVSKELYEIGDRAKAVEMVRRTADIARLSSHEFETAKVLGGCARSLFQWSYREDALALANEISHNELRAATLNALRE